MTADQNHQPRSNSFDDDPILQALAGLDPAASDQAPVVGSDRHLTILEHAMSTPTGSADSGGARLTPLSSETPNPHAIDLDAQAAYPAAPSSKDRRRGPGRLAVGIAAILATFAGGFAINTLTQPDGASTPEAAMEGLFDAIDAEDLMGVVESLEPAERQIVRPTLERLSDELERTGVVSGDLDLGGVDGLDLTVEGLDLRASYLADDVATVQVVDGTIASSGNVDEMPLGRVVKDLIASDEQYSSLTLDSGDPADLSGIQLVARRVDGSWHVSLLYTAAELIRTDMDPQPDPPSFGRGIAPKGAESPEAAVRELVDAAVAVDTRRMIELMPPGEGDVFHDYGPILIEEYADQDPTDIQIEALDLEVTERSGNTAQVGATRLVANSNSGGETMTIDYDGECTVTEWTYRWTSWNGTDEVEEGSDTDSHNTCDTEGSAGSTMFMPLLFDVGEFRIQTVEHDGLWYVSPANSVFDTVLGSLAGYDEDQLEQDLRMLNSPWLSYSDEFWDACGVERPAEDVDMETGYQAIDDCFMALPEDYSGSYNTASGAGGPLGLFGFLAIGSMRVESSSDSASMTIDSQGVEGAWPGEECYMLDDGTAESREAMISCMEGLVEEGLVDPTEVQSLRCSDVFQDLYADGAEPTAAEQEEADRAWEECMTGVDFAPGPGN